MAANKGRPQTPAKSGQGRVVDRAKAMATLDKIRKRDAELLRRLAK